MNLIERCKDALAYYAPEPTYIPLEINSKKEFSYNTAKVNALPAGEAFRVSSTMIPLMLTIRRGRTFPPKTNAYAILKTKKKGEVLLQPAFIDTKEYQTLVEKINN